MLLAVDVCPSVSFPAGAPWLQLIPTCAISDSSCKVIMFSLGESRQCLLVLMVECRNGPPPVPGEKM